MASFTYSRHCYGDFSHHKRFFVFVFFFGSSVNILRRTYVRYCRSAIAQKLFPTGPWSFRRVEQKATIDGLDRHPAIVYSNPKWSLGRLSTYKFLQPLYFTTKSSSGTKYHFRWSYTPDIYQKKALTGPAIMRKSIVNRIRDQKSELIPRKTYQFVWLFGSETSLWAFRITSLFLFKSIGAIIAKTATELR